MVLKKQYVVWAQNAADHYCINPLLLMGVIIAESNGDAHAVSRAGAVGLCQFMEATARDMGLTVNDKVDERRNPEKAIWACAKYLSWIRAYKPLRAAVVDKDHELALMLAGYNAGVGRVDRYAGIPPFDETLNYIVRVRRNMKELETEQFASVDCPNC